jgi:sorbitol/mannitol transport system substrate-binding protein
LPTRSASRWPRQGPRQARQLALGLVAGHPAGTQKEEAARSSSAGRPKHYTELVASKEGWANVPPGTRTSLYANPEYQGPFAKMTLDSINSADPTKPTEAGALCRRAVRGHPGFAGHRHHCGQIFSAALAGEKTADEALAEAQDATTREMTKAGYIK